MVNCAAPGPVMVRFLLMTSSPVVSVIRLIPAAKLIVLPGQAAPIAARKLPGPPSLLFVTMGLVMQGTLMLRVCVTEQPVVVPPLNNSARMSKLKLPDALGVPVSAPVAALSVNPAGSVVPLANAYW